MVEKENTTLANGYTLVNQDKVNRALDGAMNEHGEFKGGIRAEDGSYDRDELLAEYDRLGGLIKKGEDKVRTGSFYDFKLRKARNTPRVEFEFRINGELIYVPDSQEKPNAVKAMQILEKTGMTKKVMKEKLSK